MLRKILAKDKILKGIYCLYLIIPILTILLEARSLYFDVWPTLTLAATEAIIPILLYRALKYFITSADKD